MNAILLTLALLAPLLIAGTADTNPPHDQTCWEYTAESWDDDRHGRYQQAPCVACQLLDVALPDPCRATMELAMRAMEPFTWEHFERTWHRAAADQKEDEFMKQKQGAAKQWTAAKACWREP